jgi:hypothetical protein
MDNRFVQLAIQINHQVLHHQRLHDSQRLYYSNSGFVRRAAMASQRHLLDGYPMPGYRWKPLAKPKTFWQRLRESMVEKIILIIFASILLVLLSPIFPNLLLILGVVGIAFTILPPLLFPSKEP